MVSVSQAAKERVGFWNAASAGSDKSIERRFNYSWVEQRTVNSEETVEREESADEDAELRESEDDVERTEEEVEHDDTAFIQTQAYLSKTIQSSMILRRLGTTF